MLLNLSQTLYTNTMAPGIIGAMSGSSPTKIYALRNRSNGLVYVGQTTHHDLQSVLRMHARYYKSVAEHGPLLASCYLFMSSDDLEDIEILFLEEIPAGEHRRVRDRGVWWREYYRARGLLVDTLITTRAWSLIGETSESGSSTE